MSDNGNPEPAVPKRNLFESAAWFSLCIPFGTIAFLRLLTLIVPAERVREPSFVVMALIQMVSGLLAVVSLAGVVRHRRKRTVVVALFGLLFSFFVFVLSFGLYGARAFHGH